MELYEWVIKEDSLYLKIPPVNDQNKKRLAYLLREEMLLRKIQDEIKFEELFNDAPQEKKISELGNIDLDGQCLVHISRNELIASVVIYPPIGEGKKITINDVKKKLNEKGVKYGIDDVKIMVALSKGSIIEEQVAFGREPRPGKDAQLKYFFNPKGLDIVPKELANGNVDFYNINLIQNVQKNQLLIEKIPATKGISGMTVTGLKLPAKDGKELVLPIGKNVIADENLLKGYASCEGHVVISNKKVTVLPVYEVTGDVDFSTGNIDYPGNVIIRGNIKENFFVRSNGDIEIYGNIEGGHAIASGNIFVKKGIRGLTKSNVLAEGNIFAKFIEHANIKSGGDVVVNSAIMHSNIDCYKTIQVGGRKGLIVGGICRAGQAVICKNMGSNLATHTNVEVGISPELRNKYLSVCQEFEVLNNNLEKTLKALEMIQKLKNMQQISVDKPELFQRLCKTKEELLSRKLIIQQEKEELEEKFEDLGTGFLEVSQNLYSGVIVTIGKARKAIINDYYGVKLVLSGMDINILTL